MPPARPIPLVTVLLVTGLALLAAAAFLAWRAAPNDAATTPPLPTAAAATATDRPSPTPSPSPEAAAPTPSPRPAPAGGSAFLPLLYGRYTPTACDPIDPNAPGPAALDGQATVWHPLTLRVAGPAAAESDDAPNPFLDYRLTVRFVAPSGRAYDVPGFFAGDGRGGGAGDQWAARFSADEPGRWHYCTSFRAGPEVAVADDPAAGRPTAFDGASGAFDVAPRDPDAAGFLRWGRLEYVGGHYLKFRDGPYWIKTGADSPENFLAYTGFEDTTDEGGRLLRFLHTYAPHVADWREGDPTLPGAADEGRGIIGAINYLAEAGVNSIYFLPMNLGGDGDDTWPFLSPDDVTHYDIGKLEQWLAVFEHAQRRGVALHVVLNETEPENRAWLDRQPAADHLLSVGRRLYYRELVARFAHLLALKWNLSEESVFTGDEARGYAAAIQRLDWAGHPIAVHNPADWLRPLEEQLGHPEFSATAIQYVADDAGALVEAWRAASTGAGRPWIIDMDENRPAGEGLTPWNAGALRKEILYDVLFSGGNIEWYMGYHDLPVGGDLNLEDFRTRAEMWAYARHARRFLEEHTPFWLMAPADDLLSGASGDYGGGEVLALPGQLYAIYLPTAAQPATLSVPPGAYTLHWFDPRNGDFEGQPQEQLTDGALSLGLPPANPSDDWVALIRAEGYTLPTPNAYP